MTKAVGKSVLIGLFLVPISTTASTTINLTNTRPISSTAQANDQKTAANHQATVIKNATATDATLPSTRQRLKAQEESKDSNNRGKNVSNMIHKPYVLTCLLFIGSENDKENDSRSAQNTQSLIQRRRRPKRRSTGVVHLDGEVC